MTILITRAILAIAALLLVSIKAQQVEVYTQEDLDDKLFKLCTDDNSGMDDVKDVIAKGANLNRQDSENGQTPLMGASLTGRADIVRHLLDIKADVTIGEMSDYNAPHGAAFQGRADVMKVLIEYGIDVNVHHADGYNPLMRTCWGSEERHFETFKVLVDHGVDPTAPSIHPEGEGQTCLERCQNDMIKEFLSTWKGDEF